MSKKKNHLPIPFEDALKTCTKGSQQKVIWTCPECNQSGIRLFKSAIKIKLCKTCQGRRQVSSFDLKGDKNPWFGKVPPCVKRGSENPMWKGGKPNCKECNKSLTDYRTDYCKDCFQLGERNHFYNPDMSDEDRIGRQFDNRYNKWAKSVKLRDLECKKCGSDKILHAHHMNNWGSYPKERYNLNNGITLCKLCHLGIHSAFGKQTTKEQTLEYIKRGLK